MSKPPQDGRATLAEIFAAARSGDLTAVELRLWLIVRSYDSGRGCYAATDTLAAEMTLSRRYVESLRSGLVKGGWLNLTFRGPKEPKLRAVTPQQAPQYGAELRQQAPNHATEQEPKAPHKAPHYSSDRVREYGKDTDGASQDGRNHRDAYPDSFERFWAAYPRRISKKAAYRKWQATLRKGATPEELVEAARRYTNYCEATETETRFIKYASTFLGPDEHWREEWTVPSKNGPDAAGPLANLGRLAREVRS